MDVFVAVSKLETLFLIFRLQYLYKQALTNMSDISNTIPS